jgi:hypothetical protein
MKRKNKRGQFYLLAAIIIIGIILGLTTLPILQEQKEIVRVYNLAEELNIESGKVIEYNIIKEEDKTEDFIERFEKYAGDERDLYFIYGNAENITQIVYSQEGKGEISTTIGGKDLTSEITGREKKKEKITPGKDKNIEVIIGNEKHDFKLKGGESFFFVISEEVGGSKHTAISE